MKNTIESLNQLNHYNNRLTVLSYSDSRRCPGGTVIRRVNCLCICGNQFVTTIRGIVSGTTLSCGCYKQEQPLKRTQKYFPHIPGLYDRWYLMIERCYNPRSISYKYYGKRGVRVCDEWKNDYQAFLDWALKSGYKKDLQIDKDIKGTGLLYCPEYCVWVSPLENANKKIDTIYYEYRDHNYTIRELQELSGIKMSIIWKRLDYGWDIEDALNRPVIKKPKRKKC